jgi:type IV conjugative transfer system protein TraL
MERGQQHVTIKTLDNSLRMLFWTIEEFACMAIPIVAAIAFSAIYLVLASLILKVGYQKITKRIERGVIAHRLYWMLPYTALKRLGMVTNLPPSHYRELNL